MAFLAGRAAARVLGAARKAPALFWTAPWQGSSIRASQEVARCQLDNALAYTETIRGYKCPATSPWRDPILPPSVRCLSSSPERPANPRQDKQEASRSTGVARQEEDPFDTITDRIPERPVSAAEAGSYSIIIFAGLAVAAAAGFAVVKELVLEPKEYQVFNKALERVKSDSRVTVRLGTPITGYGQESRNRATRQRISHRIWKDEDGVERIQVQFHIRGSGGAGLVHCEMFKDPEDRGRLKFTYLLVDITSPVQTRIMLESYVPSASFG